MPVAPDLRGHALNDRYELHALIGEGAFGRVYRGVDRRLARAVAVKVIKPWWSEDPEWVRRFERETQLLARVDDPGIVRIFDVGHAPEGLYYVAELVDGESLASRIASGPIDPSEACEIAEQLCRALAQAHAQNIVHRDVKPGNVLLSVRGQVKVGDFGVAHLADASSEGASTTIAGTPRYMAPEQGQGRPATPATDVYSVGVILYEMLAGRPPFPGSSPVELALRHLQDPPPPLESSTPEALRSIVERALAKDPLDRYRDAGAMARALSAARAAPSGVRRTVSPSTRERVAPTWVAPRRLPRRTFNPAARRRALALLACVIALPTGMVAVALATGPQVRVPKLTGLSRFLVTERAAQFGLHPAFSSRYDKAPPQAAIAQVPPAGVQVSRGTTIRVVLSAGPPPVPVPRVTGQTSADARTTLESLGLHVSIAQVPAPGEAPQTVAGQSPRPGTSLIPGTTVSLRVAEWPRWQPVIRLEGDSGGRSAPFRIHGPRWRLRYSMEYQGTCTWIVFCSGPSATVVGSGAGSSGTGFDLSAGRDQTQTFGSGPGVYQVSVTPGGDNATWSMTVEDYY